MDCSEVREDRMDVLYGEAGAEALSRVEAHHAACAACRDEFAALRSVRRSLAAWRLPERARQEPARRPRPLMWLAAAAGLLLAVGGAVRLSGASFEYRVGGGTLHIGASSADVARLLQEQEARHQQQIRALQASLEQARPAAARPDDVLLKVEQLMRENEQRHSALLSSSLERLEARSEAQRRYDLARVSAGLSYLDGKTGQHVARTSELMGYVLQASEKK
jgi:hypothetical protein